MALLERKIARYYKSQPQEIVPNEDDIHNLLAFANHLYGQELKHSPLERLTTHNAANQPLVYPTHHPWRLSKVIDSLANICVAQASGEIIAAAFRSAGNDLEIIVASNGTVPHDTLDYLVTIWDLLRKISMRAGNLPDYRNIIDSPPHKINDTQLLNLVKELEINIIKFTFLKIQKRITSKMDKFLSLPVHDFSQQHPI
jgi:hypothetical protein